MMPSTRTRVLSPSTLLSAVVFVATFSVFACSNSSSSGDGGATGGSTGTGGATSGTGGGRAGETGAGGSSGGSTGTGAQSGATGTGGKGGTTGTGGQGGATGGTTGHGGAGGGGHGGSGAAAGAGGSGATGGAGGGGGAQACLPDGSPCSNLGQCCSAICAGTCNSMIVSDRNMKRDFAPVNDDDVLKAVDALPISSWSYKSDSTKARHIGPMAQDFMSTFHVGSNDKTILQVDGDGVSLAAIKALSQRVKELEVRNRSLEDQVSALRAGLPRSHRGGETRRRSGAP
jgi:hypothetical protein